MQKLPQKIFDQPIFIMEWYLEIWEKLINLAGILKNAKKYLQNLDQIILMILHWILLVRHISVHYAILSKGENNGNR